MLLVPLAVKTVLSISQNGINQITLNKQLSNHYKCFHNAMLFHLPYLLTGDNACDIAMIYCPPYLTWPTWA